MPDFVYGWVTTAPKLKYWRLWSLTKAEVWLVLSDNRQIHRKGLDRLTQTESSTMFHNSIVIKALPTYSSSNTTHRKGSILK